MRKNYRKKKFNKKRKSTYKIFFLILVGMTVGFAAINTTLQLIGTLNISKTTWNIHWDNPTKTGGVAATTEVKLKDGDNTTVEYQVNLKNPGDYYEFTVDAKNEGTIDAMITGISNKVYENNVEVTKPDYIEFTVTYADDKVIANNHLLAAGKSESYKVKVQYKSGLAADQLPTTTRNLKFTFTVTYMQADENATTTCGTSTSFSEDSWDIITCNVQKGNLNKYHVGDTKIIKMDLNNDNTPENYTLRIANISTPVECNESDISQSACGFVLEFADIIAYHRYTPYVEGDTTTIGVNNKGGWEYSDMRAYLNSTTYAYENIDYSTSGIYSSLPVDLRSMIINTKIVSGYSNRMGDLTNFITIDKIYLLDPKEVYGISYTYPYDTAKDYERQLDYYHDIGVTESNYSGAIKKTQSRIVSWWGLRSAMSDSYESFFRVNNNGYRGLETCNALTGVSPAFRIA